MSLNVLLKRNRLTTRQIRRINAFITEMVGPVGKSYLYETIIPINDEIHTERTEARKIHLKPLEIDSIQSLLE